MDNAVGVANFVGVANIAEVCGTECDCNSSVAGGLVVCFGDDSK